jgi:hypothetical protein
LIAVLLSLVIVAVSIWLLMKERISQKKAYEAGNEQVSNMRHDVNQARFIKECMMKKQSDTKFVKLLKLLYDEDVRREGANAIGTFDEWKKEVSSYF